MREECRAMLKVLTGCEHVFFTARCNESIRISLRIANDMGRSHLIKQEEGGWLTYRKYGEQANLAVTDTVTDDGLFNPRELLNYNLDEVLIINSLGGYIVTQPMEEITGLCIQQDIFLINDVSGSIGLDEAKFGDIIIGSFGTGKPVNLGTGGFLATNSDELAVRFQEKQAELDWDELAERLKDLVKRREKLHARVATIREDLKDMDIAHPDDPNALNVVVKFSDEAEKQRVIDYCKEYDLEFTTCPREIRVLDDAISIEVKRLE